MAAVSRCNFGWSFKTVHAIWLTLAVAAAPAAAGCGVCHRRMVESYARTAHANASRPATVESVLGPFDPPRNRMDTRRPGVYFVMERGADGRATQTGVDGSLRHTEALDLVIGSGRRGQSYLYWRDGLLFQLPVSYHISSARWINSPGYEDGAVHFGRGIPPLCFGCHATRAELEPAGRSVRYKREEMALGMSCVRCHGEPPARHTRGFGKPDGLKTCASCHAGLAGERPPEPDVHGNQVGLLWASRCFKQSGGRRTCVTCHDVHQVQRDAASFNSRCVACHPGSRCSQQPDRADACVNCHMPLEQSKLIAVQTYRSHRIAVYRKKQ
ncbi:MAG: hypothetical protein FJW31_00600 [Acidobacteria bacterium]|nr:hypothetical protein [Acidobacteriota bacterium]